MSIYSTRECGHNVPMYSGPCPVCKRGKELKELELLRAENASLQSRLEVAVEAAKLGLSFAPTGPVPKGLCEMSYHTLDYDDEVKLQDRIYKAREALSKLNSEALDNNGEKKS